MGVDVNRAAAAFDQSGVAYAERLLFRDRLRFEAGLAESTLDDAGRGEVFLPPMPDPAGLAGGLASGLASGLTAADLDAAGL